MNAKTVSSIPHQCKDITGQKFNRMTVSGFSHIRRYTDSAVAMWDCVCDCGEKRTLDGRALRSGKTKSCGCYRDEVISTANTTHGYTVNRTVPPSYMSWQHMRDRCYNPETKYWPRYGGRGIQVCSRWRNSFGEFAKDMFESWKPKLKIDRINNDGHYSCGHCDECNRNGWPANCKWSTDTEQARNRSSNRIIEISSIKKPLYFWLELLGVKRGAFYTRLNKGMDEVSALMMNYCGKPIAERIPAEVPTASPSAS